MSVFRNNTGGELYLEGPDSTPQSVPLAQGGFDAPSVTVIKAGATVTLSNYYKRYTVAGGADPSFALTLITDDGTTYSSGVVGTPLAALQSATWTVLENSGVTATIYANNLKDLNTLLGGKDARYLSLEENGGEDVTVIVNPNDTFTTGTEFVLSANSTLTFERDTLLVSKISFRKLSAASGGGLTTISVLYGT